jgi:hypothetical protein
MSKVREAPPEGFDTLWKLWLPHARKSDGPGKARPTYRKWLLEGAEPADILDGARYHLRTMKAEERPYIQLLSVYLNSERWVDECEQERAYQRRLQERQNGQENVVSIRPQLPENHFSRQWERMKAEKS